MSGFDQNRAPLVDRRLRAREAGLDAWSDVVAVPDQQSRAENAVDDAIEAATRVRITPEVTTALLHTVDRVGVNNGGIEAGLRAAFEAAGFEVEQ